MEDFCKMQLDLLDKRAQKILPDLLEILNQSEDKEVRLASKLLQRWDCYADLESVGACLYYPFLDRFWQGKHMHGILGDEFLKVLPLGAPGLNLFDIGSFSNPESPWKEHEESLKDLIQEEMRAIVDRVKLSLGDDPAKWRWGNLHKIEFWHSLRKQSTWKDLTLGPDEIGGSPTTLGMAMHIGKGPGRAENDEIPYRVFHGPAYRLVVDLADPLHAKFVIAGGNGGRADSDFSTNQYESWLKGEFFSLTLEREEIDEHSVWQFNKTEK